MDFLGVMFAIVFPAVFVMIMGFAGYDYLKSRGLKLKGKPKITFIMPCYNDADSIAECIESINQSYSNNKIIIINDASTDDSLKTIKQLKSKFNFRLIDNKRNMGKAVSINNAVKFVETEIFFVVDGDMLLNKQAIEDVIARFNANKKVGAVSCRYKARNRGFLPAMENVEYNMLGLMQHANNMHSVPSLWGGCMAFRKEIFIKIGKLSTDVLTEDIDASLKMAEKGYKVEESWFPVKTIAPDKFKVWWKQQKRWNAGTFQCLVRHFETWIKNPIYLLFNLSLALIVIVSIISLIRGIVFLDYFYDSYIQNQNTFSAGWHIFIALYGATLISKLVYGLSFTLFSLPYAAMTITKKRELYKLAYIIPFSLIYYPLMLISFTYGFFVYLFLELKSKGMGWRKE
jgi:biofilm PGA synthesis N-glycosyltransferase PgaC